MQRLEPVTSAGCSHVDCQNAAVGYGDRRSAEWRLYEELRSLGLCDQAGAAPPTASPSHGLAVPFPFGPTKFVGAVSRFGFLCSLIGVQVVQVSHLRNCNDEAHH